MCVCVCVYMYVYMYTHTHTHTHIYIYIYTMYVWMHVQGTAVVQWLRRCATNRKVAGSIPHGVTGIFH